MQLSKSDADFKPLSKAQAYARTRALQETMDRLVQEMNRQVASFKSAVRRPPLHLCVQRQANGHVYLRWRQVGIRGDQPYLLLESHEGKTWLKSLDSAVRRLYMQFGRTVMYLNFLHASALQEAKRLERYIEQLDQFDVVPES